MIIPPNWNLPEPILKRLSTSTFGRQRAIVESGHLLLMLHKPPGPDDTGRDGVMFWRAPSGEWTCSQGGGDTTLKRHIQSYAELEANLTREFEKAATTARLFDLIETLTPLERAARNMHHAVQAARDAVEGDTRLVELRDLAYDVDRNFELLVQDVRNAIDHKLARESEEQSRLTRQTLHASHRLNILAALFFPLTAITSLFGMNFDHGFDHNSPVTFWVIFAAGTALGLGMKTWVLASDKSRQG